MKAFTTDEFDALAEADVKNWSGPFEITVSRRLYRIEQGGQNDVYADTIDEAREIIRTRLETDAKTLGDGAVPRPAQIVADSLDDREMIRAGGTIVIVGSGCDIRIVQQDPELSAQTDAIV